jgi:hypothetical protein
MERSTTSTTARKLVQAAAFAAVLVPLGSVAVETSSITCGFYTGEGCGGSGATKRIFDFSGQGSAGGPYKLVLDFDTVFSAFDVTVTDVVTTQGTLADTGRLAANFPNHTCVPIMDGLSNCVEFLITAPAPGAGWSGPFDLTILWFPDTNGLFPNGPGNRIRILHNRGDVAGNGFDTDTTILGSYFPGTPGTPDPGISTRDDNFQSFLVTQVSGVPEPATLLLVGMGLTTVLYKRRRRRHVGAPPRP